MSRRPPSLDNVWTERDLCEKFDLPIGTKGHSRAVSSWIKGGLKYVEKADRRFFFEEDVIDYLWSRHPDASG